MKTRTYAVSETKQKKGEKQEKEDQTWGYAYSVDVNGNIWTPRHMVTTDFL